MPDRGPWRSVEALRAGGAASTVGLEAGTESPVERAVVQVPVGRALPDDETVRKLIVAAYDHLGRRGHSRGELGARLRRLGGTPASVEAALDWLTARGLLDDRRYAEEAARVGAEGKRWGRHKLRQWLQQRGVSAEVADEAVSGLSAEGEKERAASLAAQQRARGKRPEQVFRFLVSRGYSSGLARSAALSDADDEMAHDESV